MSARVVPPSRRAVNETCKRGLKVKHEPCISVGMTLVDFITERGDEAAASLFKVTVRTAASWRRKERRPKPAKAREIERTTGGLVSMQEVYTHPDAP